MSSSLSSLVDNVSEGLHNDKCTDCKSYLDYMSIKNNQLIPRCFECKKNYKKDFNKELMRRFANISEFCNGDINKFILLLRKRVYLYEYMDSWERFDEILLPRKEDFHSSVNMENITINNNIIIGTQKECLKSLVIKSWAIIMICMFSVIHYYLQMYLRILDINALKYLSLIQLIFCMHLD